MSRQNPRSPEWEEYYRQHPDVIANWGENNGREPTCPNTGRSASVCEYPDHRTCPVLGERV